MTAAQLSADQVALRLALPPADVVLLVWRGGVAACGNPALERRAVAETLTAHSLAGCGRRYRLASSDATAQGPPARAALRDLPACADIACKAWPVRHHRPPSLEGRPLIEVLTGPTGTVDIVHTAAAGAAIG